MTILERPAPVANVRLRYGNDAQQFGDLWLPAGPGPHPVVIGVHGGFWRARYDLSYYGHLCATLATCGVATWNIEYRRVGQPGGGWPGTLADVAAASDYLRTLAPIHQLDLNRVVPLGHSAGGQLALWLAARAQLPTHSPLYSPNPLPVRGAVSLAGVSDLQRGWEMNLGAGAVTDFIGGAPAQLPDAYASASPAALLPLGVPQRLIHGNDDDAVPIAISEGYVAAAVARGDDATLLALPHTGHFELVDPQSDVWSQVQATVLALL